MCVLLLIKKLILRSYTVINIEISIPQNRNFGDVVLKKKLKKVIKLWQ